MELVLHHLTERPEIRVLVELVNQPHHRYVMNIDSLSKGSNGRKDILRQPHFLELGRQDRVKRPHKLLEDFV